MRKTIYEHLNTLHEPYKSKAITNYLKRFYVLSIDDVPEFQKTFLAGSVSDALNEAFLWDASPEGHDYWSKLKKSLEKKVTTDNYSIY